MNSLPKQPILKGEHWTRSHIKRVVGHWLHIGWADAKASVGICTGCNGFGEPVIYLPRDQERHWIDSPGQIIRIGPKIKIPKF
jgi:hypothetical protein